MLVCVSMLVRCVMMLVMCMLLHEGAYDAAYGVLVWGVYKLLMGHAGAADDARRSS